jgi:hypothetical protein
MSGCRGVLDSMARILPTCSQGAKAHLCCIDIAKASKTALSVRHVQFYQIKKALDLSSKCLFLLVGVPKGIRTPVAGVKGRCPGPG